MRKYVLDADALVLVSVKIAQNAQLVAIIKIYKFLKTSYSFILNLPVHTDLLICSHMSI